MEDNAPQIPTSQEAPTPQAPQTPQQPPAVPQAPPESTLPPKFKKGLKTKKSVIYLIFLSVLIIMAYIIFIAITYSNCSKITPEACEVNKCGFSLSGFNLVSDMKDDCCGNEICEVSEVYPECMDCPNCDDENKCTLDSHDYNKRECVNKPILDVVCCGNTLCEEGYETSSDCSKDCPNCDDNNRLTADSFNYKTQKCENIVTHYFIEDFEEESVNWQSGGEGSWEVYKYDGNYVLKGIGYKWNNVGNNKWDDYNFESKIKLIKGGMHIIHRVSDVGRYFIGISENGLSLGRTIFPNAHTRLEDVDTSMSLNTWYTINIVGKGSNIKVYVDNKLMIDHTDIEPLYSGRIGFEILQNSEVYVDNVELKVIAN